MHQHGHPLTDLPHMQIEWEAWQNVVKDFIALGLNINEEQFHPLVASLELWGEELHALRHMQTDDTVNQAYDAKRERYDRTH